VGFSAFCQSDPILSFLRSTYNAIPLKIPDPRLVPLVLFTSLKRRVRYLGELRAIPPASRWAKIQVNSVDLPDVAHKTSTSMSLSVAINLLGPFLGEMLDVAEMDLSGTIKSSRHSAGSVRLTLSGSKRTFVQPIACAAAFQGQPTPFPPLTLDQQSDEELPLYLVDSVLSAREITLTIEGSSAIELATKIAAAMASKVSADSILRSNSRLSITGSRRAPFAFTCLQLDMNEHREIVGLRLPKEVPRMGATGVQSVTPIQRVSLGGPDELIAFDE
jgi:hypothetical protein